MLSQEALEREKELEIFIPSGNRLGDVVINFDNVSKAFDNKVLFENLTFHLPKGSVLGVIGPNGAGKTTLFRLIVGQDQPDSGKIEIGSTVELAYVDQEHETLNPDDNVFNAITGGHEVIKIGNREVNARAYVSRFNFSGSDQTKKVSEISGGERNRVHLARILKAGANVILLDEPTNDLDVNTLRALEEAIENFGGCAIIISHDRWFLDRVATHILSFEGNSEAIFYEGNFSDFLEFRTKKLGKSLDPKRVRYRSLN
jgi:ATPase subunit of ABC transporter with duplicated ATPase domains